MTSVATLRLNFLEVRRRSELAWRAIPDAALSFRCDPDAMALLEQVRHVLEGEYLTYRLDGRQYIALMGGVGEVTGENAGPGNRATPFSPKLPTFTVDGAASR